MYGMPDLDMGQNDSLRVDEQARRANLPGDPNRRREEIMELLWHETELYHKYFNECSAIQSRPQAEQQQIENNRTWLRNHENAIDREEQRFLEKEKDVVAMIQEPRLPLERVLRRWKLVRWLFPEKQISGHHAQSSSTAYFDDSHIRAMSNVAIVTICMGILIGTMAALNHIIQRTQLKEITIGVAAVVLAGFLAWATDKKAFEVVTSMATYAIIVVQLYC
ncbi:MAG: hypothetical protein M1822_008566 [Bathelium mastoideum]|nr:MAG: hypothetical protein M1822_008566 [Bathelium mastoideum]